jgi:NADH-quinone oxidoreductase subunit M
VIVTLSLTILLIGQFLSDPQIKGVDLPWLPAELNLDIRFHLALDGVSLWLFGLSALLFFSSVLVSWEAIDRQRPLFFAMLLLLETGCLGVFAARDILMFYVFFEFTLIPLFFLIGIWGSEERRLAARKFFLYTLAGSLLTFLGLLVIVLWVASKTPDGSMTFDIAALTTRLHDSPMPFALQLTVFWALFAGFAIKVPLFPLHTWLPLAHVQAPTAGSVILAGILLKIGTYGFLRFNLPMLPEATAAMSPVMIWLSTAGIIYGALVALVQPDMKRLIAYSSVSHLGFCMLGLFALNRIGSQGALLQMINHGISTGALFAIVGMLYERYHTRQISELSGIAAQHPWLTFFMVLFTLSSVGLPGLNGFTGEILVLMGMFQRGWIAAGAVGLRVAAVLSLLGVVLGAWYMLWLVQRVFFGARRVAHEPSSPPRDLNFREITALAPLAALVVWIGVNPSYFLAPTQDTLNELVHAASAECKAVEPNLSGMRSDSRIRGYVACRGESSK